MSRLVISVDHLSKMYRIGQKADAHGTFREAIVGTVMSPFRKMMDLGGRGRGESEKAFWALKEVSFDISRGEIVGVIGRNGAGKSTLLKTLSRITEPTSGTVRMRGRVASLLEVGTGFHPELSGRENIYLNGAILGMKKVEINRKFDEIVAFAEVEEFLETPVKRYSSGMYVRLAFSVAAHLEPEILIVDEVLAVGDAQFQRKCLGKMQDISGGGGRTVLFVSHQMGMIRSLCSRAIVLKDGRVIFDGETEAGVECYERSHDQGGDGAFLRVEPDESLPMQLLEVEFLVGHGGRGVAIDMFEPARLRVHYRVRHPLSAANIAFAIICKGTNLLGSFDTDESPEMLDCREPGEYEVEVDVPTHVLKAGVYTVTVACGFTNRDLIQSLEHCLRFEVPRVGRHLAQELRCQAKLPLGESPPPAHPTSWKSWLACRTMS